MKERSGIMLGFSSYLISSLLLFGNLTASVNNTARPISGPIVIDIGAPHKAAVLNDYLESHGLSWPLESDTIPGLVVRALPRDMAEIHSSNDRKSLFLRALLPIVLLENHRLAEQRKRLNTILQQTTPLTAQQEHWLAELKKQFRLKGTIGDPELQGTLLRRLDTLPPSLVLAQAAIESGWGTSRFAQQGNSLFGQWSYKADTGLVPDDRNEGANHVVRAFDSLQESVRSYMRNLNTHAAYRELRLIRESMRNQGSNYDSYALAHGLLRYSQRGEAYIEEVQTIIRGNRLTQYDQISLAKTGSQSTNG